MKGSAKLLAVALSITMLVSGIVCLIDMSDHTSAAATPDATVTDTLCFNSTDAAASVAKINAAAGDAVCTYGDNTLTFTKSVNIVMAESTPNKDFFLFNESNGQKIEVEKDVTVQISYKNTISSQTSCGAIKKTDGSFDIIGDGNLAVNVSSPDANGILCTGDLNILGRHTSISSVADALRLGGNLRIERTTMTNILGSYNAVTMTGPDPRIEIIRCNAHLTALGGYTFKTTQGLTVNFDLCDFEMSGTSKVFNHGVHKSKCSFIDMTGSLHPNGEDQFKVETIDMDGCYYLKSVSNLPHDFDIGGIIVPIVVGVFAVFTIVIVVIIIVLKNDKRKRMNRTNVPAYAPPKTVSQPNEPVRAQQPQPANRGSSFEMITQSMTGESFVLSMDGTVIGYVGPQKAYLTVPGGMREVALMTNDGSRKTIFKQNMIVRQGMTLTIEKKLGSYKVTVR